MELFNKQVSEDHQHVIDIDYVTSHINNFISGEQEAAAMIMNSNTIPTNNMDTVTTFSSPTNVMMMMNNLVGDHQLLFNQQNPFLANPHVNDPNNNHNIDDDDDGDDHLAAAAAATDNLNNVLPYDHGGSNVSAERTRLGSPMHFNYSEENKAKNDVFFEGSEDGMMGSAENIQMQQYMESLGGVQEDQLGVLNHDKEGMKPENGRSDSMSNCSDQFEDEDDGKYRSSRRAGKGPQAKNLVAERRRRKKLNDRLLSLRTLVPKISKLDKAHILVDAIAFVKELQKQAKELQDELEERSDDDHDQAPPLPPTSQQHYVFNGFHFPPKQPHHDHDLLPHNDKLHPQHHQQMEVQVQVAQIDGNEFFVKVFCEHKPGGFVRLMEALDSLGLEVTNANVTSFRGLVSNVFKVEKKDSEMVQADYVRDSLLELTRDPPPRGWPEMAKVTSENCTAVDDYHHHHHHHHHLHNGHLDSTNHHLLHHHHLHD